MLKWFFRKQIIIEELRERLEAAIKANEEIQKHSYLVDIDRKGRVNRFIFMRRGEIHAIETMGLISDDLPNWKRKLL